MSAKSVKIEPGVKLEKPDTKDDVIITKYEPARKNKLVQTKFSKHKKTLQNATAPKKKTRNFALEINMLKNNISNLSNRVNSTRMMFYNAYHNYGFPQYRDTNGQPNELHPNDLNKLKQKVVSDLKKETKSDVNQPPVETSSSSLFIGIWDKIPISLERLIELKRAIIVKIMKDTVNGVGPHFNGCQFKSGWLQVICRDYNSLKWLRKIIPLLKPWYGAELMIKTCIDLKKDNIIVLHAPGSEANSPHEAKTLLKAQNPSLNVEEWDIFNVVYDTDTLHIHFYVTDVVVQDIRKINFKAYFGFKDAVIEVLEQKKTDIINLIQANETEESDNNIIQLD